VGSGWPDPAAPPTLPQAHRTGRMPGALIEPLSITDPFEGSIPASRHGQQVIAGALAKAIEQYFAPGK